MRKKLFAMLAAASMVFSFAGCSNDDDKSSSSENSSSVSESSDSSSQESQQETTESEEPTTEPQTEHVSPIEKVSSTLGTQITLNKTIERTDGSNTCSIPLSSLVQEGDVITSFTFIVYSGDGKNIGTYKGGCGIAVSDECSSATDDGWYQCPDFSTQTEGTYGEIKWDVPAEIRDYINTGGEVLFGYWWGNAESIRLDSVVCTYTRTKELPVDTQVNIDVNKSVGYNNADNTIKVPLETSADGDVPQAITFDISSNGSLGKFTGAFGISCDESCPAATSKGWYQSEDVAVFTESSSVSLTWFVPDGVKNYVTEDGEVMLGYWWSNQSEITLNSVSIKYSQSGSVKSNSNSDKTKPTEPAKVSEPDASTNDGDFRSAKEIISAVKVGWNLGNTLECYNYKEWTTDAETAWGNPTTTKAMIQSVKDSGFNAIRLPVTWGEHLDGNTIDEAWMNRVQEVVDYAYDMDMYVILNVHHDDYTWLHPSQSEYEAMSSKLCDVIWTQIANRFEPYGDRLIFEGMNEPRTVGSAKEWTGGTAEEREVINKLEQDFVDCVRASGGNNAERTLVVTSYAAAIDSAAVNDVIVPNDSNVVVSIHYYSPWKFVSGENNQWGSDSDKTELSAGFKMLKEKFIDNGTPVIIGEFGAVASSSDSVRAPYYEYYISSAKSYGIKCFVWDNGAMSGKDGYGIFNRNSLSWNEALLQAIINGAA